MGRPIDISEILMKVLSPELHNQLQMEFIKQKYPQQIKSDSRVGFSGLEDRFLTRSPDFVGALIDKNEDLAKDMAHGALSGAELDKIIMDFANSNMQSLRNIKGSL